MAIYQPATVQKRVGTRSGDSEAGAEVVFLSEDDEKNWGGDHSYFKIKLGYNGVHHYVPIIPKCVSNYFDSYNNTVFYMRKARDHLKKLARHVPQDSTFKGLVHIAHQSSHCTAALLQQFNAHTGTTGTAGAARVADFNFPFCVDSAPPSKKRKATASTSSFANIPELEDTEDTMEGEEAEEEEEEKKVTRSHTQELKKGDMQCFCGGAAFPSLDALKKTQRGGAPR